MKTTVTLLIISVFFFGCQPSIKKENRINTTFNFEQVSYTYFDSEDYGGLLPHYGSIIINHSAIKISIKADDNEVVEDFLIKKVTYEENKKEYKYQTNAGEFIVKMNNKNVTEIIHYSSAAITYFHHENIIKGNHQTHDEFDSKMLINKEDINYAQEVGSTYYTEHDYFYGVITSVDKNFDSFKIKVSKSNENNIHGLGYDISGLEWNVMLDQVNYLDNNEMCEIGALDFKKLMVPGRKLKFSMVEGYAGSGTAMNGIWFLTYAKEFNED